MLEKLLLLLLLLSFTLSRKMQKKHLLILALLSMTFLCSVVFFSHAASQSLKIPRGRDAGKFVKNPTPTSSSRRRVAASEVSFEEYAVVKWEGQTGSMEMPVSIVQRTIPKVILKSTAHECYVSEAQRFSCPDGFTKCRGNFSAFSYCWEDDFTDRMSKVTQTLKYKAENANHEIELGYLASEGNIFAAEGMFTNYRGEVFDEAFEYLHGARVFRDHYSIKKGTSIRTFGEVLNLIHPWDNDFYHQMIETMIRTFQARKFILANPRIPFTMLANTDPSPIFELLLIKEIPPVIFLQQWETIYAKKSYMPLKIGQPQSSHAAWTQFRTFYFKEIVLPSLAWRDPLLSRT